ncbi:ribonuclease H-like domain-containing protein [Sandaracinus amylolyticus]|uniref:Glutamate synthase [NADPH] large chain n=1 Tax=Sandaracinus amylolyticus TaxID=927083 RepID=A0A0F6W5L9_9BACT|nr:ribonuclease H-like domain-containing protein [Sandaracinus amylolyticus]AKF08087.1 Glutamate synthase [NADPH] large chain [Sandaracinus amylolyticus]
MDLKRKLARLGAPGPAPQPAPPPPEPVLSAVDLERRERIARLRATIDRLESRDRVAMRTAPRPAAVKTPLPGTLDDTPHGPLHRVVQYLPPAHHHGRIAIARALEVRSEIAAALALDPALDGVDLRKMLLLDTETTGLSGGTGTLPFLIGMAWFEDESLRVEQLFLRRPGEERPLLARLAERIAESSCIVTYNGKSFDWPLLRTRAVLNRVPVPTPRAHLDLLHCARRVFARRLGQVRLVQIETEVLGMRRERDVDGAEIPHLYWDFVRGAEGSVISPVIEHNANDLVALAALLATLGERWQDVLPAHEPEDRLGIARVALRHGDLDRAARFAEAAASGGGDAELTVDALLVASSAARARARHDEVLRLLRDALDAAPDDARRAPLHLALAKHLEHRTRDPAAALAHAGRTAAVEGEDACAKRVARLAKKRERDEQREAKRAAREAKRAARALALPLERTTPKSERN